MKILLWGLVIFFLAFFLHLVIWRIHVPRRQTKILLQLFFATLVISFICLHFTSSLIVSFSDYVPRSLYEYIHISFFFASFVLVYVAIYSAIEVDSPTLLIVMKIVKSGQSGLTREKLLEAMTDDLLVKPRIKDLINVKMVSFSGNKYRITKKGTLFVRTLTLYRKLLRLQKGG